MRTVEQSVIHLTESFETFAQSVNEDRKQTQNELRAYREDMRRLSKDVTTIAAQRGQISGTSIASIAGLVFVIVGGLWRVHSDSMTLIEKTFSAQKQYEDKREEGTKKDIIHINENIRHLRTDYQSMSAWMNEIQSNQ